MEVKVNEIPLTGLSLSPNERDARDGNLAIAMGVLHDQGAMSLSSNEEPLAIHDFGADEVIYQHAANGYRHLICAEHTDTGYKYYWVALANNAVDATTKQYLSLADGSAITSTELARVNTIGNTLILSADITNHYLLWKESQKAYTYIGDKMPELVMDFGLETYRAENQNRGQFSIELPRSSFQLKGDKWDITNICNIPEQHRPQFTDTIIGLIAEAETDAEKRGLFYAPFLIRYAYRLYDGTITYHSSPVLITPTTSAPVVWVRNINDYREGRIEYHFNKLLLTLSLLNYKIYNSSKLLANWGDIIKSVDIFVSRPIRLYKQGEQIKRIFIGEVTELEHSDERGWFMRYKNMKGTFIRDRGERVEQGHERTLDKDSIYDYGNVLDDNQGYTTTKFLEEQLGADVEVYRTGGVQPIQYWDSPNYPFLVVDINEKTREEVQQEISTCSEFRFLTSIDIKDLAFNKRQIVKFLPDTLSGLASAELMTEAGNTHDTVIFRNAVTYNSRLHAFNSSVIRYPGANPLARFPFISDTFEGYQGVAYIEEIEEDEGSYMVSSQGIVNHNYIPFYLYSSNEKCKAMHVFIFNGPYNNYKHYHKRYEMRPHEGITGAIATTDIYKGGLAFLDDFEEVTKEQYDEMMNKATGQTFPINERNTIRTSNVNNPFSFDFHNEETVGNGEIISLVPSTIALSEGQFGAFPMYCFTTDGIWALSVSDTGGWSARQPVSRDVALSASAILQLDQAIMFATERGLMLLSGSNVECVSDVLNGDNDVFVESYLTYVRNAMQTYAGISVAAQQPCTFKAYMKKACMSYDYVHQRVIISNSAYDYCYVYSIGDRLWTCLKMKLTKTVNSYPNAMAMAKDKDGNNMLIDLTQEGDSGDQLALAKAGFVVTRTLKLGDESPKVVTGVEVCGTARLEDVGLILYASDDMEHWAVMSTSSAGRMGNMLGTPHRYWRVGLAMKTGKKYVTSVKVQYEERGELEVI